MSPYQFSNSHCENKTILFTEMLFLYYTKAHRYISSTNGPVMRKAFPCCHERDPDGQQFLPWWRHQMETVSALLALCAAHSLVTGDFPTKRPVTRGFDIFFDLRLNKRWVNNREADYLRRHRTHYDVIVMMLPRTGSTWWAISTTATKAKPLWLFSIDYTI